MGFGRGALLWLLGATLEGLAAMTAGNGDQGVGTKSLQTGAAAL
jgi:hypothetical protein